MARTIKEHEYTEKRNEILAAAQRLVYTKGYERMTIQDILTDLKISSGAFYHYFDSKSAVLEAMIEFGQQDVEQPLLTILHDPHLSALQKLQRFFDTLDSLRIEHKPFIVDLLRVWYADDNAIVRDKVDKMIVKHRAPLLNEIVRQGIAEGVFTLAFPAQAGEIILSLLRGMGNAHTKLLLALPHGLDGASGSARVEQIVSSIVAVHAAYMDAIERVLGAPNHALYRADAEAVNVWVVALTGTGSG